MKSNIGQKDRFLRLFLGIALLIYAWWQGSWIALILALFTFYEVLAGWCAFYQLIGKNTCPAGQSNTILTKIYNWFSSTFTK